MASPEAIDPNESPRESGTDLQPERLVSGAPGIDAESRSDLLRFFIDRAPASIAMFDREMRYIAASRRFVTDFRVPVEGPEALIGRSLYEHFPETPERWREVHSRVLAGESLSVEEEPFERSDGRTDWVRWEMTPWHLSDGSVGGASLFGEVITERKETQQRLSSLLERLEESEQHLESALRVGRIATFDFDSCGRALRWNTIADEIWGVENDPEVTYDDFLAGIHPEDRARVHAQVEAAQRTGRRFESEYRVINKKTGATRWVHDTSQITAQSGAAVRMVGIAQDITQRKGAQAALRENAEALQRQRDQLTRITSSVGVLITQCSRDFRYLFVNRAYAEFMGRPAEQIVGKSIAEVTSEEAFQMIRPYIGRVLAGERIEYEIELLATTGPRRMHVVYAPDLDSQGTVIGWIGTLSDITERRRAEQKLREKEQFLAMLGHELRNPLTPIGAGVELLQHTSDAQVFQSTLSLLGDQVAHLERLLDDLLDVSRVTLGKIDLKMEAIDVRAVAERAVQSARASIESMNHRVTVALPRESIYVRADPVRLAQVLGNLLNNACKYMDAGGSIVLSVKRVRDQAFISVRDEGVGFAAEDIPRMFELFAQLDASRQRSVGGLGVGLTLAKAVVEQHGGTLEAHSEGPGHGSQFVVRLPIMAEKPRQSAASGTAADMAGHRRVLIVEDRLEVSQAISRLLQTHGHITRVVDEGLKGVQAAEEFRPEIVLLDVGLPDVDGYETCRRIRREPWGKGMVLVALSGYVQAADVENGLAAGFDHYLRKPVHYQTLAQIFAGERCDEDKLGPRPSDGP